ncbi:hypothetical protein FPV67DRAFT_1558722 [Lyophyllum atratum]|nr:hypothetical protein FPV67DRAFT_1558722 [Lyophyllum atratum]
MPNIRVLRDIKARHGALPPQVRHQAQLQLNTFGRYTRPTTVKNRCSETGRGRGIMSEFALCADNEVLQFQFRLKALKGELNGVQKASW